MARYKPDQYAQVVLIPVSLPQQLAPGTLEYTLHELIEHHMDLSVFEKRYHNDHTGATAIHPKSLLKVILFANSRGLISSRQIERACRENIVCMALSGGYCPDHSTLAQFVSSMQAEIEPLFANLLLVCDQLGLLGGTHFSLDGVKLPANAAKEWRGTFAELKKKRDKLQAKLHQVITEHLHTDGGSGTEIERRQQQQQRLLQQVERLNAFLQTQSPKIGKGRKEIQSNVTDNQSAKMLTSHGVLQGYNAQVLVDSQHQIILQAAVFSSQDHDNLAPMLSGAKQTLQAIGKTATYFQGKQLTADSNYFCSANLVLCQAEQIEAYIPDIDFRQRDLRYSEQQRFKNGLHARRRRPKRTKNFTAADFVFDPTQQVYRCPHGNVLTCHAHHQHNRYRIYDIYHAQPTDCANCPLRHKCLSQPNSWRRYLSVEVTSHAPTLIEQMKARIDSPPGRQIYARRLAIVEPVFANLRVQKRLDHFTLRSKTKVDVQWKLFALVHNIGKIHRYGAAL